MPTLGSRPAADAPHEGQGTHLTDAYVNIVEDGGGTTDTDNDNENDNEDDSTSA